MSYDLMVFDPTAAPREQEAFMAWYDAQTQWGEGHSYDNAQLTTPELRAWYDELRETFPAMNGPDSPLQQAANDSALWDDPHVTDYSVGRHVIYAAFAWSIAEQAREAVVSLAEKHRVGFFDASGNGRVVFPGDRYE
jgi:hypothetical protein